MLPVTVSFALRSHGTREEPGTLTQGGALFSLDPLVWESNPKLQGGQRRGDVEIKSYLQDAAGHRSLVFDLSITHDRIGSGGHVQQRECALFIGTQFSNLYTRTVCYLILRTLTPPGVSLRSAK